MIFFLYQVNDNGIGEECSRHVATSFCLERMKEGHQPGHSGEVTV
jgi:hypothetical protein